MEAANTGWPRLQQLGLTTSISYLHLRGPECSFPLTPFGSALASCNGTLWTPLAATVQTQAGESRTQGQRKEKSNSSRHTEMHQHHLEVIPVTPRTPVTSNWSASTRQATSRCRQQIYHTISNWMGRVGTRAGREILNRQLLKRKASSNWRLTKQRK